MIFSQLPHLMGAVHIDGLTSRQSFKPRHHRGQQVMVGVLNRGEVVLATRHWRSSCCEKAKGEFDGDHLVQTHSS
jgi:hypothetical protein